MQHLTPGVHEPRDGVVQVGMSPEGTAAYRRRFASFYLPYGVAAVRDIGSAERLTSMLFAWM